VLDEVFPSSFDISSELVSANTRQFFQFDFLDPFNAPKFEIGQINVSGSGGIIGSLIQTADIGPITVGGGFGILNSQILSFSDSRIANITTDGYGLRDDIIEGGASMDNVRANGNGELLNANAYTPSVRNGGKRPFEPYSGIVPNASNDLYRYLGVTEKKPKKKSVSEAGVFQDTTVHALLNGGNVQAYKFRERRGRNRVTFGNTLGEIVSLKTIDGLTVSAGSLKSLIAGSDVARLKLAVAGPISRVQSNGTIKGSSVIRATGPDGRIRSITTKKSLYATIRSTIGIDNITVGDSVGSKIIQSPEKIGTLAITNSLMTGATVDAHLGTISKLIIGGDVQAGAVIAAKAIDKQKIGGTVEGDIIVK